MSSFFKRSITFFVYLLIINLLVSPSVLAQDETETTDGLDVSTTEAIPEEAIIEQAEEVATDEAAVPESLDNAALDSINAVAEEAAANETAELDNIAAAVDEATTNEAATLESIDAGADEAVTEATESIEAVNNDEPVTDIVAAPQAAAAAATTTSNRRTVNRLGIDTSDEFSLDMSAPIVMAPAVAPPDVTLPDAEQDAQLQDVLVRLALDPADTEALVIRNAILADVITQAHVAVEDNQLAVARRMQSAVRTVESSQLGLAGLAAAISTKVQQNSSIIAATNNITAGEYFKPEGNNAFARYTEILNENPEDQVAIGGMNTLLLAVIASAKADAQAGSYEQALALLDQANSIPLSAEQLNQARGDINAILATAIVDKQNNVVRTIDAGNFSAADTQIAELVALGANADEVARLRLTLADARVYGGFSPGQQIQDSFTGPLPGQTPIMVVIPAGEFLMGADSSVEGSSNSERPVHLVTIARGFALAQHEVTVGQFMQFVNDTKHLTDAERLGKSRIYDEGNGTIAEKEKVNWRHDFYGEVADLSLPVIHVSWEDASSYVAWLSENTNRNYRLPSEAEFEYSLRGGTLTDYWWGDGAPEELVTNVTGIRDRSNSGRRWTDGFKRYKDGHWGPAPVTTYIPNAFGLYDMGGNVTEWVEDCWHSSYVQAPADGSAWVNPGCNRRVLRGASWSSAPDKARSASRISAGSTSRFSRVGFRVARDL